MTPHPPNPVVARRLLAMELRQLRAESGMRGDVVAEQLYFSPSRLSRVEHGTRAATPRDVAALLDLYSVTDPVRRAALMDLSEQCRRSVRNWRLADPALDTYLALEQAAWRVQDVETLLVPGLLQTQDYARAVFDAAGLPDEEAKVVLALRVARQKRLLGGGIQLHAVVGEGALHRAVGGHQVMAAQLDHMVQRSLLPQVRLQIVAANCPAPVTNSFAILDLPAPDLGVVHVGSACPTTLIDTEHDVARLRVAFAQQAEVALSPSASRELITRRHLNHTGMGTAVTTRG
jgi:transcriptional regulator with XRE-family HTH domain